MGLDDERIFICQYLIHFGENHLNILKEGNKIKQTKVNLDAGCDADSQVSIII